jgi:hypothetical protein
MIDEKYLYYSTVGVTSPSERISNYLGCAANKDRKAGITSGSSVPDEQ